MRRKLIPAGGLQPPRAAVLAKQPPRLARAHEADGAQHERADALRVCGRVRERQRHAPAAAEDDLPLRDAEVRPEALDVGDEVRRVVVLEATLGR
eukprot:5466765-Prymnesium_polylepis.2